MKKFLEVAKFTKPQGLRGELRAKIFCDSPDTLEEIANFYIGEDKKPIDITLSGVRKGFVIIKIFGVDDYDNAVVFVGETLYIDRDDFPLPENTWFVTDLIGLEVVDADSGEVYGRVDEIFQDAPKDVYSVKTPDGRQLLFPAIPEVLIDVDTDKGRITIRPLKGLFE